MILADGLLYANDLSKWLTYKPTDPTGKFAGAWHSYTFNSCSSEACWNSTLAPVAVQVPLAAGEIGENTCGWNTWNGATGPS
ncbi:hypothetical protein [Streptomyces turgidiscabies]|uniref:Uncharacterized protein n=1 Tax=Streptomyces turgidiscabies TaxID=85558 RepID=A0ABU0RY89_9ACTN|nr:hypothetical protein [Streptomyces turgidiscabies]